MSFGQFYNKNQQEIIEEIKRRMAEAQHDPPNDDFSRTFQKTVEQKKEEKTKHGKKVKSRRVMKVMFSKCPLCNAGLRVVDMAEINSVKGFKLVQFGSNPDDTGFETYWCDFCQKFFLMFISPIPINVTANFSTGAPGQKKRKDDRDRRDDE